MKISKEQFQKAIESLKKEKNEGKKKRKTRVSKKEISLLIEILKNLPESTIRHLNYQKIKEELKKVTSEDVAEKVIIREIVDKLMKDK